MSIVFTNKQDGMVLCMYSSSHKTTEKIRLVLKFSGSFLLYLVNTYA